MVPAEAPGRFKRTTVAADLAKDIFEVAIAAHRPTARKLLAPGFAY